MWFQIFGILHTLRLKTHTISETETASIFKWEGEKREPTLMFQLKQPVSIPGFALTSSMAHQSGLSPPHNKMVACLAYEMCKFLT